MTVTKFLCRALPLENESDFPATQPPAAQSTTSLCKWLSVTVVVVVDVADSVAGVAVPLAVVGVVASEEAAARPAVVVRACTLDMAQLVADLHLTSQARVAAVAALLVAVVAPLVAAVRPVVERVAAAR